MAQQQEAQIKLDVQTQFAKHAQNYVQSESHAKGQDLFKLLSMVPAGKISSALDIATGGGHVANGLAPLVHKVTALDLTSEILKAAQSFIQQQGHSNVEFVQGDAEKLPFPSACFELVTCRIAPHHFPQIELFVQEVYRVLKRGGQFLLIDNVAPEKEELDYFYNQLEKMRDYSHVRAWKKTEWLNMLESQGFRVEEWYRYEKRFDFQSWTDRMGLDQEQKEKIFHYMRIASLEVQEHFKMEVSGEQVDSFQAESIILRAVK
nr:methyltransferase domain-containing protein [Caldalkalibacillus mannanilyticus]